MEREGQKKARLRNQKVKGKHCAFDTKFYMSNVFDMSKNLNILLSGFLLVDKTSAPMDCIFVMNLYDI